MHADVAAVIAGQRDWCVVEGDCLSILPTLPDGCVGAVVTDPPYPEIDRDYGRWTEAEWFALMDVVVPECRRALAPDGSAVFVLQPNSERVGRMRTWLWKFLAKWGDEWGQVQDVWWWNPTTPPTVHCNRWNGLYRPSLKACVWLGDDTCYRNQDAILWTSADAKAADKRSSRALRTMPSGLSMRDGRCFETAKERGGSTPFNVLPIPVVPNASTATRHGATTPMELASWWVRYLSRRGDVVLDPFCGTATVGHAATSLGRRFIGIEKVPRYADLARKRLEEGDGRTGLFAALPREQPNLFPDP